MSSSKNSEEAYPSTSLNLAVLDPGVLSSTNSFTEKDYENRHTASRDIGSLYDGVDFMPGTLRRHYHRSHRHHSPNHNPQKNNESTHAPLLGSNSSDDQPIATPSQRVQAILGKDGGVSGNVPKPLFSEMEELLWDYGDFCWKETARWIKFEEDVEESGNRFTKPHVGTLTLRSLFELRSLLLDGCVIFDIEGSTLDQISSTIVDRMIHSGSLALELREKVKAIISKRHLHVFECEKKKQSRSSSRSSFTEAASVSVTKNDSSHFGKGNTQFMRKIPPGAEAANILIGEVDFLHKPLLGFVRLSNSQELDDLTEVLVATRFIFLLLGSIGNIARYHEIGRAVGTLMSDDVFHEIAYKAGKKEHLIAGIDEFLDSVTLLPPGEWDPSIRIEPPDHLPSQDERKYGSKCFTPTTQAAVKIEERKLLYEAGLIRTRRLFGGLINDFSRKRSWLLSDFKDNLSFQTIASWMFLYFGCLATISIFGKLLGDATKQRMASIEALMAGVICGIGYGLFSGQPLTILSSSGVILVFEATLFEYCEAFKWDYLSFRLWTGVWIAAIMILLVASDASAFVSCITRFTEESFITVIGIIFILESFEKLFSIQEDFPIHPPPGGVKCFCRPPANDSGKRPWSAIPIINCTELGGVVPSDCSYEPNVFMMSVVLFVLTSILTFNLKDFKDSSFFRSAIRGLISDFAVVIVIICMTVFDYYAEVKTPKLTIPSTFAPTMSKRAWLIPLLNGNPWWTIPVAILPALLAAMLIFMNQHITAVIVNRRENKLNKGCGYHLDLFVVAILIFICAVLGLPFFVAATVLSVNHVGSLTLDSKTPAPGDKRVFFGVMEQRVTQLLISTTVGLSVFFSSLLKFIPMPVLYAIFLYMGVASLKELQFVDRLMIMLMPRKYQPDLPCLRKVQIKRVHVFTVVQLACLVMLWVVKSVRQIKMLFPLMLLVMIGIRRVLGRYFTMQELKALDGVAQEFDRRERGEVEECPADEMENEIKADYEIVTKTGKILRISVPLEFTISEAVKKCQNLEESSNLFADELSGTEEFIYSEKSKKGDLQGATVPRTDQLCVPVD